MFKLSTSYVHGFKGKANTKNGVSTTIKHGDITQNNGVVDPFLTGHGDSR